MKHSRWLLALWFSCALAAVAHADSLITRNALWRYFAGPSAPVGAWSSVGYDDALWAEGPGVLGYGELYINTPVPFGLDVNNRWITTYFRRAFTVTNAASVQALSFLANYDDGFIAYLNGVEVARVNMPAGPVSWGTSAVNILEGGSYVDIPLALTPGLLQDGTNLLAVELHQRGPTSSDLVWDAELSSVPLAVSRGPYLQSANPGGITVRWRTNVPASTRLDHGSAPGNYDVSITDPALVTEHEVVLTGLAPGASRAYAIGTSAGLLTPPDASYTFTLPPPAGAQVPVRAWIVGDSGLDNAQARAVRDRFETYAANHPPDLWLMLGDNAYAAGTDTEYQTGCFGLFPRALRQWPLFSTRGNHDLLYAGAGNDYYDLFTLPASGPTTGVVSGSEAYYSFDWGPVHFIGLDSEGTDRTLGGPMLQWLRLDLAATTAEWIVAFWHHPPYTKGTHDSDNPLDSEGKMTDMRTRVLPILDSTGVDLVLCGHSHVYERSYLLNGHYGLSTTLTPAMKLDAGDGRPDGSGAYQKAHHGKQPFEGSVYAVAGSSAQLGGVTALPCMVTSLSAAGSMVLDVNGSRLEARFLDAAGAVRDSFAIVKGGSIVGVTPRPPALRLALASPQPSAGAVTLEAELPQASTVSLEILDASGRRVATLLSGSQPAGTRRVVWRGAAGRGRPAGPGVYFAVLRAQGELRVQRVVLVR